MSWLKPKIPITASAVILLAVAFGGTYVANRRDGEKLRLLTEEVPATIENVDVQRSVSPVFGNEYTVGVIVTYIYEVDGHLYERKAKLNQSEASQFVPWSTGKVCYDPHNNETIENPTLFPARYRCGTP